ncbi:antA/AntB antirepressor family protein [Riemerella anatipestifer]|nr:antA/AntB antirepressor family protein [Riemerella anatipestifer]
MELIRITERNDNKFVSARELYHFLEVKSKFSEWINRRIEEYGFIEGQDYICFSEISEKPQGGRPAVEYSIILDMAKELSMVERTEKGKQARRYFIECERRLKEQPKLPTLPIKQQKANLLMELTELIKIYLYRGDIQMIAATYDVEPYKIRSVLKGKSYEADILKVLYEKAMQNKAVLKDGIQVMINNLKA